MVLRQRSITALCAGRGAASGNLFRELAGNGRSATYKEYTNERPAESSRERGRGSDLKAFRHVRRIPVEILDGHVYQDMSANDRKARIYALVFLKS